MAVEHGTDPVRWWVEDSPVGTWGWDMAALAAAVPPKDDPRWEARYDNDCERGKRTLRDWPALPGYLPGFFSWIHKTTWVGSWQERVGYPLWPDPTDHGGGLHVTEPGGHLSCHLDYDLHPHVPGRRRALNLIYFLNPEWREEWGGALVLTDPLGNVRQRFHPKPGRMVAFEVGDLSYHGVEPVARQRRCVYCGAADETSGGACRGCWPGMVDGNLRPTYTPDHPPARVTAAVYYLSAAGPANTRQRALFLPRRS